MRSELAISTREPAPALEGFTVPSPFVLEFFLVEALGFRGMAYCDRDGNWCNASNHDQLMGHIYLLE
jgi:hypothetical protein